MQHKDKDSTVELSSTILVYLCLKGDWCGLGRDRFVSVSRLLILLLANQTSVAGITYLQKNLNKVEVHDFGRLFRPVLLCKLILYTVLMQSRGKKYQRFVR